MTSAAAFQGSAPTTAFLRPLAASRALCAARPAPARTSTRRQPRMEVYQVQVEMNDETHDIPMDEELTLLESIEEFGLTVPYSCRAGVCITCAAKILSGEVDLGAASITDDLKEEGYVLTCSGYPRSKGIRLEMLHFDDAYEKQYGRFEKQ